MKKVRYKHKIFYWAVAAVWLAIGAGWVYIATDVDMQRIHFRWLSWIFVVCYIGLAAREIYYYFKDKNIE